MTRRGLGIASALVVAAMAIVAWWVGSRLPADAMLPTHWNAQGVADGHSEKWTALLMPAGLVAGVALLFQFLPRLEPRREGLERSQGLYLTAWAAMLAIAAVIQFVVVAAALGWQVPADRIVIGAMGVMFAGIGNQLGKSRSTYMVGIRTPWTLASEEVWIKTHRLGGKLMMAAGLTMVLAALVAMPGAARAGVVVGAVAGAVLVPVVYSYIAWRRERDDQRSG